MEFKWLLIMKYKLMQVFDCQDMPDYIRGSYFQFEENHGNDCYLSWQLDNIWVEDEFKFKCQQIDNWLRENGCTAEEVLIAHWW